MFRVGARRGLLNAAERNTAARDFLPVYVGPLFFMTCIHFILHLVSPRQTLCWYDIIMQPMHMFTCNFVEAPNVFTMLRDKYISIRF